MTATTTAVPARESAAERIRKAAIASFKARGYHGTPVRTLAESVRIEAASLYYHFPSKQDILFGIFERIMNDLLEGLRAAIERQTGPEARLREAVRSHVRFHTDRRDEAFISHSELRSLTERNRRRIIAMRDRYERMFRGVLSAGVRAGVFEIIDLRLATIAILMMCSGVSDWFSEGGRLAPEAVADSYADMVVRLVSRHGGPGRHRDFRRLGSLGRRLPRARAANESPEVRSRARRRLA